MVEPSPRIANLSIYKSRKQRHDITLALDSNEGRAPTELLEQVRSLSSRTIGSYPKAAMLEAKLAARIGVDANQLVVTAGADDALDRICRAVLYPSRNVLLPSPTFEMLPRYAALAGGEVRNVPWLRDALPCEAMIATADSATSLMAVVTPNNPTGAIATASDLMLLRRRIPQALLVVDLAYGELADVDLTEAALALDDTIVVRTLSKAWGLAGLRVGYAIGSERVISWLRRVGNPYAVAAPSLALAELQLDDAAPMQRYVERIRKERITVGNALDELGAQPLPSQGNFVLCEPPDPAELVEALATRGIAVRTWPDDALLSRFVRISCPGDEADLGRLLTALSEVLS